MFKRGQAKGISANFLVFMTSVYIVLVFNYPFLSKAFLATVSLGTYSVLFLISIPVLLLSLVTLLISLFSWQYLLKPILIFLIILSSLLFYGTQSYGIIFDYGMIQNAVDTNFTEATSYLCLPAFLTIICLGFLPAMVVYTVKINWRSVPREFWQRVKLISLSVISIVTIGYCFYSNYAAVGRNHKELVKYIVPFKFIDAGYKYTFKNYFLEALPFEILDSAPYIVNSKGKHKQVFVMVVGETATASHFSYNGYAKKTNQFSSEFTVDSFSQVSSCGTATAVSVPCMFSLLTKKTFDKRRASNQQNILDLAKLAGVDVLWIDNDSGCKGVCQRVITIEEATTKTDPLCDGDYCFDEILVRDLKQKLTQLTHDTTLIVLHMIGSHGPTYYRRYPEAQKLFIPDCPRSDIQNCSHEELTNSYDNTIAYTDFVLAKVIGELQKVGDSENIDTAMLYISDHGESLGEKGVYLHGLPYAFAPKEQTHVPMLYWKDSGTICEQKVLTKHFSHDNIAHTVLGQLNVKTTVYQEDKDILLECRVSHSYAELNGTNNTLISD